jgi:aldehyde:ferredoxin oxidoreductase
MPPGIFLKWLGKITAKLSAIPLAMVNGSIFAGMYRKWGTSSLNQYSIEIGDSPIKNWKGSIKDFPAKASAPIDPDQIKEREKEKYHCYSCPLGCGGICHMKGKWRETHKPEYETTLAVGGLLLNKDVDAIFYINEFLNRAGMDTISAGGTVAFAQECYEKGIITQEDTGGIDLSWGNTDGILQLLEKMVNRDGIGDLLADGVKRAAAKIGKGSESFAIQAGGQELAMHDPRNDPGFGLHASVDPAPGKHSIGAQQYYELYALWKQVKGLPKPHAFISVKGRYIANKENAVCAVANSCFSQFYNGAGLCLFGALTGIERAPVFQWMNAATGWNRTPNEYMEVGRRLQTLKQCFNIKHGIEPMSLKATARTTGSPPLEEGPNKGRSFDLEKMMKDYWQEIGWDIETGKPTDETINQLGLSELVSGHEEKLKETPITVEPSPIVKKDSLKGRIPVIDKKKCTACSACIQECPVTCLELVRGKGKDPRAYPELPEPGKCISCGFCRDGCPVEAIEMKLLEDTLPTD